MRKVIPLIALTSLMAAGCGDNEKQTISKSEYIARAGAICTANGQRADAAFKRIIGNRQPRPQLAHQFVVEAVLPIFSAGQTKMRALPVPNGSEREIKAIRAAGRQAEAGFQRAAATQAAAFALMTGRTPDPAREVDALNRRYGVVKCGGDQ